MTTYKPDLTDVRWGDGPNDLLDIARNRTRDLGGNPWVMYRHGGSGVTNDKRLPWNGGSNGNAFSQYLTRSRTGATDLHFDFISVGTDQYDFTASQLFRHENNASVNWSPPNVGVRTASIHAWNATKRAIIAVKERSGELGLDPNRGALMGSSYGAINVSMSQLTGPLVSNGIDSRVRAVINHEGALDFRNTWEETPRTIDVLGLTYSHALRRLTLTGAFTGWRKAKSGDKLTVVSGTGATAGVYTVQYAAPSGAYVTVEGGIGAGADGQSDIRVQYHGVPPVIELSGGTFTNATLRLTKTDAFKVYGHTGERLSVTAGTGVTVGGYRVVSRVDKDTIVLASDIGGTNPSNVVFLLDGDINLYSWHNGVLGSYGRAQWDRIPYSAKRETSLAWYVETGQVENWVPHCFVYEKTGTGVRPYGQSGGGDVHDSAILSDISAILAKTTLPYTTLLLTPDANAWKDGSSGLPYANSSVYSFLEGVLR